MELQVEAVQAPSAPRLSSRCRRVSGPVVAVLCVTALVAAGLRWPAGFMLVPTAFLRGKPGETARIFPSLVSVVRTCAALSADKNSVRAITNGADSYI